MNIHEIMKEKRKRLGLTQKEVAKKLFVEHNTYSQYENGNRKIDAETLFKIAEILDINLMSLQSENIKENYQKENDELDFLTKILNRRSFVEKVNRKIENEEAFVFALIDIDPFKKFNDQYGHDEGDKILKHIGNVLNKGDFPLFYAGRTGGAEFAFITEKTESSRIIEQILTSLNGIHPEIGFTFGTTVFQKGKDYQQLYEEADMNLFQNKEKK